MADFTLPRDGSSQAFPQGSADIKKGRRDMAAICNGCNKHDDQGSGYRFQVCGNCRASYCSRECQKADWNKHKPHCQAQPKGLFNNFGKICRTLMANKVLCHYVEVLIALELDLINKPSTGKPLKVEIWTDFEPSDTHCFVELFKPSAKIDSSPMQGMFQLCAITSKGVAVDESNPSITPPGVASITFVRATGHGESGDGAQVFEIFGSVSQAALDFCRRTTELAVPIGSSMVGQMLKQPISVLSCIDLINGLIERDTKNTWLLRMSMQEKDKQIIRNAMDVDMRGIGRFVNDKANRRLALLKLMEGSAQ